MKREIQTKQMDVEEFDGKHKHSKFKRKCSTVDIA